MPCSGATPPPRQAARQLSFDDLLLSGESRRYHRFRRGYVAWLSLMGHSNGDICDRTGHNADTVAADCRQVAAFLEDLMKQRGFCVRETMRGFNPNE